MENEGGELESEIREIKRIQNELDWRIKKLEVKSGDFVEDKPPKGAIEKPFRKEEKAPASEGKSLEIDIGKKWFNKIGIISIIIGMAFFVKYSLELGMLGPIGKIIVGIFAGIILIIVGEFLDRRKEYTYLSRTITGGGLAVLYITVYAAYEFYHLIPKLPDLGVLILIAVFGVIFSIKYSSRVIAIEAFLLGYLVSLMGSITPFTLAYNTILAAALVWISIRNRWGHIGGLGLVLTYLIHLGYRVKAGTIIVSGGFLFIYLTLLGYLLIKNRIQLMEGKGLLALFALVLTYTALEKFPGTLEVFFLTSGLLLTFFLAFTFFSFVLEKEETIIYSNFALILINAFLYFTQMGSKIDRFYDPYLGLFTIALAATYLGFAHLAASRKELNLSGVFLGLCITFLTITVPIQLHDELVTIAWAIEGLVLVYLGFKIENEILRYFGIAITGVTFLKTAFFDATTLGSFNIKNLGESTRLPAFLASILSFYALSFLFESAKDRITEIERDAGTYYVVAATILTTEILALELSGRWISTAWAIYAIVLLLIGFYLRHKVLRLVSLGLFSLTIYRVFIIDLAGLETIYRVISFLALGLILLLASYAYGRFKYVFEGET